MGSRNRSRSRGRHPMFFWLRGGVGFVFLELVGALFGLDRGLGFISAQWGGSGGATRLGRTRCGVAVPPLINWTGGVGCTR